MKHIVLGASTLLALTLPATAQSWSENFDTYANNTVLNNVGGWFGWDNVPANAGTAINTFAHSGTNSLRCVGGAGYTDAVHPNLGVVAPGKWRMTAWQYIPTGALAAGPVYFILNNSYTHGGPYTWAVELQANGTTNNVTEDFAANRPGAVARPIVYDTWVQYRVDFDLNANTVVQYYNGNLVAQGSWTVAGGGNGPVALQNIDLYSAGGTCYWDDIVLAPVVEDTNYLTGVSSNVVTRASLSPDNLTQRFDYGRVRAWATPGNNPNVHEVIGIGAAMFDFNTATAETFKLHVYPGNGAPNYTPNTGASLFDSGVLPHPGAAAFNLLLIAPLNVATGGDTFFSVENLGPAVQTPAPDGLWTYVTHPTLTPNLIDSPGARLPATGIPVPDRLAAFWVTPTPPTALSGSARHLWIEAMHDPAKSVGASPVARTNQATQPGTGGNQIIGGFLSGFHPDAKSPPQNVGRADDIGYEVAGEAAAGVPFVFFISPSLFPFNVGLPGAAPKGTLCIDPSVLISMGAAVGDASGTARLMIPLSVAIRPTLGGIDLNWWAIGITPSLELIGAPCAQQRL